MASVPSLDELKKLRVVDLKEKLSKLGKSTSGLKADLVERLHKVLLEQVAEQEEEIEYDHCDSNIVDDKTPVVEVVIDTSQFDMSQEANPYGQVEVDIPSYATGSVVEIGGTDVGSSDHETQHSYTVHHDDYRQSAMEMQPQPVQQINLQQPLMFVEMQALQQLEHHQVVRTPILDHTQLVVSTSPVVQHHSPAIIPMSVSEHHSPMTLVSSPVSHHSPVAMSSPSVSHHSPMYVQSPIESQQQQQQQPSPQMVVPMPPQIQRAPLVIQTSSSMQQHVATMPMEVTHDQMYSTPPNPDQIIAAAHSPMFVSLSPSTEQQQHGRMIVHQQSPVLGPSAMSIVQQHSTPSYSSSSPIMDQQHSPMLIMQLQQQQQQQLGQVSCQLQSSSSGVAHHGQSAMAFTPPPVSEMQQQQHHSPVTVAQSPPSADGLFVSVMSTIERQSPAAIAHQQQQQSVDSLADDLSVRSPNVVEQHPGMYSSHHLASPVEMKSSSPVAAASSPRTPLGPSSLVTSYHQHHHSHHQQQQQHVVVVDPRLQTSMLYSHQMSSSPTTLLGGPSPLATPPPAHRHTPPPSSPVLHHHHHHQQQQLRSSPSIAMTRLEYPVTTTTRSPPLRTPSPVPAPSPDRQDDDDAFPSKSSPDAFDDDMEVTPPLHHHHHQEVEEEEEEEDETYASQHEALSTLAQTAAALGSLSPLPQVVVAAAADDAEAPQDLTVSSPASTRSSSVTSPDVERSPEAIDDDEAAAEAGGVSDTEEEEEDEDEEAHYADDDAAENVLDLSFERGADEIRAGIPDESAAEPVEEEPEVEEPIGAAPALEEVDETSDDVAAAAAAAKASTKSQDLKLSKNKRRKLKKKKRAKSRREEEVVSSSAWSTTDGETGETEVDVEVQYIQDTFDLSPTDPMYHHFMKIFEAFKLTDPEAEKREAEEAAARAKAEAKKEPDLRKKPKDADEEPEEELKKEEIPKLSKRKLKRLNQLSVAELKQHVNRPDVVEMHDVTAKDPKLLVLLKSTRNTVSVPRHWCFKRKYLQGKRGIEKPPFDLPDFIKKTGIMEMRQALQEKEDQKTMKAKMRERVRPKLGKIDIDYQKLHDAFFKWQTKPRMTIHGDLYYEGKELETRLREKKPGDLSGELRTALGMPTGPNAHKVPPPWLIAMQRYGPPPSYPNLKIPGLNSPIPENCSFGYHAGGWGKPPVDEMGKPLYGDVFGTTGGAFQQTMLEEEVDHTLWGELESESESESEEEEEEEDEEEMTEKEEPDKSGMTTPSDPGLVTPSGMSSIPTGMETPDMIELRKRKIESEMEGGETPALYTILPEKKAERVGGAMMGSTHIYDISAAMPGRVRPPGAGGPMDGGVEVALDPSELDMDSAAMAARYEQTLREQQNQLEKEDLSDMVAEHSAKQKSKRKRAAGQQDSGRASKKYKDFKF